MSSDRIHITNIRAYGYTGALPEETVLGQWFSVDLTLWVDLRVAGARDDLRETLDYREAIAIVQTTIQTQPYALIERLATVISDRLLTLPRITQVRIQLTKEAAPIPNFSGKIAIDITRSQSSAG
jgi:dihydroneopterin aldolase